MKCRYSPTEIIAILREYDSGSAPSVVGLCSKYGISRQAYYYWRAKYGAAAQEDQRLVDLEGEVTELSRVVQRQLSVIEDLRQRLGRLDGLVHADTAFSASNGRRYERPAELA